MKTVSRNLFHFFIIILFLTISFSNADAAKKKNILLLIPLTGAMADAGQSMQRGIELAVAEMTEAPNLIVEDTQLVPTVGITQLAKHLDKNAIDSVIVFGSNVSLAVAPKLEKQNILTIAIGSSDAIQKDRPMIFRFTASSTTLANKLKEEVIKRNYSKIAAVSTTQEGMLSYQQAFTSLVPEKMVLTMDVPGPERDFSSTALKVKKSGADAVMSSLLPPQGSLLAKELKRIGYKGEFFSTNQVESASEIQNAGDAFDGMWFVADGPSTSEFREKYTKSFGERPEYFSAHGYDVAKILEFAMQQQSPAESLHSLKKFHGSLGDYGVLPNNSFDIPAVLKVVHSGKWEYLRN